MKQFIIVLLLASLSTSLSAQKKRDVRNSNKVELQWGEEFQDKANITLTDVVGVDGFGFYAVKVKSPRTILGSKKIYLASFNKNLSQTNSVELELKEGEKDKSYEWITHINDKLYLFSSFENKEVDKNYLFVQTINKQTLLPNTDIRKIAEIDYSDAKRSRKGSFYINTSADNSKILVYYDTPFSKKQKEQFGIHIFDSDLNEIWSKQIELPYSDDLFVRENIEITDQGDVYVMGSLFKEKSERERKEVNYKYLLLEYTNNGSEHFEYEIDLDGKFVDALEMAITDNNEILCGGFYSNNVKQGISGSFFLRIDRQSKSFMKKETAEFDLNLITQDMTDRQKKKVEKKAKKGKDPELYQYDIKELIIRKDGGVVMLGEQYFVEVRTTRTQNGGTRTTYIYNYLDIIAVNISPEGNIDWSVKVPKKQITTNDGGFFSSYVSTVQDNNIFFIFNGNIDNLIKAKKGKLKNMSLKNPVMILAQIDGAGNLTKEPLLGGKRKGIIMRPKVCEEISDNELVLFGERKKDKGFVKVSFKNYAAFNN